MTRSILAIPLLLSLAPPVRAQQGVPAPNAPKALCFRGRPLPSCRAFWLTEFGLSLPDGPFGWELGGMRNVGKRSAVGGTATCWRSPSRPRRCRLTSKGASGSSGSAAENSAWVRGRSPALRASCCWPCTRWAAAEAPASTNHPSCASGRCAAPRLDHKLAGAAARRRLCERHRRAARAPPLERVTIERAAAAGGAEARLDPRHQVRPIPFEHHHCDRADPISLRIDRDVPPVRVRRADGFVLRRVVHHLGAVEPREREAQRVDAHAARHRG